MDEFTIGLALYDFLPVIFTGTAVYLITQLAALASPDHKYMAGIGDAPGNAGRPFPPAPKLSPNPLPCTGLSKP